MKLKKLIQDLPHIQLKGSKDVDITGICCDSKKICPGNLFFALKGKTFDGTTFINEAVSNGAVAIVTDLLDPFIKNVTQVITEKPKDLLFAFVTRFYDHPSKKLYMIGVTGTNGKTTITYLVKHLLTKLKRKCGLIGTNEYHIGSHVYPSTFTTPPIDITSKFLKEMLDQKCDSAVMEISSHALKQRRCKTLEFDVAIFTNLSCEHLDYHKTLRSYGAAKRKLFDSLDMSPKADKVAIVNLDDAWHEYMIENLRAPLIRYGFDKSADVRAYDLKLSADGLQFMVQSKGVSQPFSSKLIGRFNVYNLLAVISLGLYLGSSLQEISEFLQDFQSIIGRMQKVQSTKAVIYIDYAHTPDALDKCLKTLSEMKMKRIITVFGCGGNRDQEKRPLMAMVAEKYSDIVILTNDNPRLENPEEIVRQIMQGFKEFPSYYVELDREKAIEMAIQKAEINDIILIAGKGHEKKQIFAHRTIDFDDLEIIHKILNKKLCV